MATRLIPPANFRLTIFSANIIGGSATICGGDFRLNEQILSQSAPVLLQSRIDNRQSTIRQVVG